MGIIDLETTELIGTQFCTHSLTRMLKYDGSRKSNIFLFAYLGLFCDRNKTDFHIIYKYIKTNVCL